MSNCDRLWPHKKALLEECEFHVDILGEEAPAPEIQFEFATSGGNISL
jgi:hypothetical protein